MSLGITEPLQALEQIDPEKLEVVRSAIGQGMFGTVPGGLDWVELGSVGRQSLKIQTQVACAHGHQRMPSLPKVPRGHLNPASLPTWLCFLRTFSGFLWKICRRPNLF